MAIGPALPPHLQTKRKRDSDTDEDAPTPKSSSPDNIEKRRRTLGPSPPPAPLEERPTASPSGHPGAGSDTTSDSDDDYGPAPPSRHAQPPPPQDPATEATAPEQDAESKPTERDSWMLKPPGQDDLASRMDPSRIRARKFNAGKPGRPATGGSGEIDAMWTETPEQKAARLKNSVLGVSKPATTAEAKVEGRNKEAVETARRLEKARGKSLLEAHQGRKDKPKEDDPSKRAFDYEKDVGGGRVGHVQKKEMLGKAKEFGNRFSGGSFL